MLRNIKSYNNHLSVTIDDLKALKTKACSCVSSAAGLDSRPVHECPLGHFPCRNVSICLPQVLHCNGQNDCPNGADEDNCG